MYHKGDIHIDKPYIDAREDNGYDDTYKYRDKKAIMLPHSCDEWIIGTKEEAEQMIADLQEALKLL